MVRNTPPVGHMHGLAQHIIVQPSLAVLSGHASLAVIAVAQSTAGVCVRGALCRQGLSSTEARVVWFLPMTGAHPLDAGGEVIDMELKMEAALDTRDALAKSIYAALFRCSHCSL